MKNQIYMNVGITTFRNHIVCHFSESINNEPLRTEYIELDKARRLIWEIVLAGGKREVSVNRYDPAIVRVDAYIILPN